MPQDLYAEVGRCVEALRSAGFADAARTLDEALYGSTSGEILTGLGAGITALRKGRRDLPPGLQDRLAAVLREVDRILAAAGQIPPT